jgi:hypothetical protein
MKMKAFAGRQRGISLVGMMMIAAGIIFAAIAAMKLVPAYMHSAQIAEIFQSIANDPMMRGATISEIKDSYTKRASINYITDIKAEDIEVDKYEGRVTLSASYSVRIPLVGNATLLLEFNPSSS